MSHLSFFALHLEHDGVSFFGSSSAKAPDAVSVGSALGLEGGEEDESLSVDGGGMIDEGSPGSACVGEPLTYLNYAFGYASCEGQPGALREAVLGGPREKRCCADVRLNADDDDEADDGDMRVLEQTHYSRNSSPILLRTCRLTPGRDLATGRRIS